MSLGALDTYQFTSITGGLYKVECSVTEVPVSGLTVAVNQNSTQLSSKTVQSSQEQVLNLQQFVNCAPGDTISVILSSSALEDNTPNTLKGTLVIKQGVQ